MASRVTITLSDPIPWHRERIDAVIVRPPTLVEYSRHGDPYRFVTAEKGDPIYIENDEAVAGYMNCCIEEPRDKLALEHVGLADAIRIKDAILGFFGEARLAAYALTSPTSSSLTSDS